MVQHLVPMLALLVVWAMASIRVDSVLVQFTIGAVFVLGASLMVAGLVTLYSRNKGAAIFALRARNMAWALTLLLLISLLPEYIVLPSARTTSTAAPKSTPVASVAPPTGVSAAPSAALEVTSQEVPIAPSGRWPLNPEGHSLLAKTRADYPFLKDSSDEEVVRAVHMAFYKDLPLEQIAAKFGLRLTE